ncbi:MAG: ABC transporter permease subunit, partial [Fuerstiella sp.]|nr:ABC transporter permease subunit [Fuerstiella sp.]
MSDSYRSVFELPLLKRELIELAQRKRTYVLRCICLCAFALVFLTFYAELNSRAVNMMWMLGRGREMSSVLFVTLMVTIYALAPAMACAAITSEKEKQTLGLLLISRLTPHGIVLEKICSRMLPLLSLVIVAAPLFGITYLFGGISFRDTSLGLMILLFTIFQITAVAIFCSAVLETGIAAFWATYLILAVLYFTWPILVESHILPRPDFLPSLSEEEFLFFPGYQLVMLVEQT